MPRGRLQAVQSASRASSVSTSKNGTASAARQSLPPHLAYPPAVPPAPVSPLVARLRRDFRWASISQFLCSFGYAVGVSDEEGDVEALEADFDSPAADALLPKLVVKLLYALTSDRKINVENLEIKLRNQYVLRDPKNNPFGTEPEVTRRWDELGLGEKVAALHNCCEWQWVEPSRFRALVDNEEDAVYWRIEPCGWDKTGNTYWLFDDNRLWVQHPDPTPPPPPKPIPEPVTKKPSKATTKSNGRGRKGKGKGESGPAERVVVGRQRGGKKFASQLSEEDSELSELEEEIAEETGRLRKRPRESVGKAPTVTRFGRVSKTVQDSPLTSLVQPVTKRVKRSHVTTEETPATSRARSTRTSRRSGVVEDQWEPIPEEWLQPAVPDSAKLSNGKRSRKGAKRVVQKQGDSDSSELSDLSSDEEQGVPEAGIDSDLTSVSISTLSEVEDLPELVDGVKTTVNDIASAGGPEPDRMEIDSATDVAEAAVTQVPQMDPVDTVSTGNDLGPGLDIAMEIDPTSHPELSAQELQKNDPEASIVTYSDNDITMRPTPNAASGLAETLAPEDGFTAKSTKAHQNLPGAEASAANHQEVVQPSVPNVSSNESDPVPNNDAHDDVVPEVPNDTHPQQSPAAVIPPVHLPVGSGQAEKLENTEEPTKLPSDPEQKASEIEGKTVLDELSVEIQEAFKEEEDDPNDEVRSFIKKARNPGYLEWELVCASRYAWELFPKQFEESRNVDEKAFYRHLIDNILPGVLGAFRDKEVRRAKEDAVRNRKRSSRLIMNELEREARRKEDETARLMEERMQRVRDEEARQQAEEADRINKEGEREDRLREREERIREREERLRYKELEESRPKMEVHRSPRITIPAYANQRSPVLQKALPQSTDSTFGDLLSPPVRSDVIPSEDPVSQPSAPTADTNIPVTNTEIAITSDADFQHIGTAAAQQSMTTM